MYGILGGWFCKIADFLGRVYRGLHSFLLGIFFLVIFSSNVFGAGKVNQGQVLNHGALVYQEADFDAKVIARLTRNKVYSISKKVTGAFYKIKLREGVYGYIADTDIAPLIGTGREAGSSKNEAEKDSRNSARKKQIDFQRYRGFEYARINFREDTMDMKPTQGMDFFGIKLSGPDVALEGSYTDANFLFALKAPDYYEQGTGKSATGFVMMVDALFETALPQGKNTLLFYGFGPLLKYSKFDVALNVSGKEETYAMTDISLGAAFNLGLAQRVGGVGVRAELQYYWEKMQYLGFGVALQLPF